MVVVYGLVLGPVLHVVADHAGALELPEASQEWVGHPDSMRAVDGHGHEHGHSHPHGKGHPHRHAWGAVEHLQAVALTHPLWVLPRVFWDRLHAVAAPHHEGSPAAPLRLTAMPQGP